MSEDFYGYASEREFGRAYEQEIAERCPFCGSIPYWSCGCAQQVCPVCRYWPCQCDTAEE